MRNRRGFTMVEMLMVLVVVSILAGLGLLKYIDLRNTARAAALAGDFRSVQIGALNYYADKEQWPPETAAGTVPNGLAPYLQGPLSVSFDRTFYELDYENIRVEDEPLIGISVISSDPKLMAKFIQVFSTKAPFFVWGAKLTYVISGPGGMF